MQYEIWPQRGMINRGNWAGLKRCMKKALAGERVTVGFLGGSITQGSLSSTPQTCYAWLVFEWWKKKFPDAELIYENGGIGGTTSQFGVARVKDHILSRRPDFLLIEFAVNDENTEFFQETYEGLIRTVLKSENAPAVLLMNNARFDNGENAEEMHLGIARAYALPMVSMKSTIWPQIRDGRIPAQDVSPDGLHPNDAGHRLVAQVIVSFLEQVYSELEKEETPAFAAGELPAPVTANAYEDSVRYQNGNSTPLLQGFAADKRPQKEFLDIFSNGFTASRLGDRITFRIFCTGIAVQYRKSVKQPTPIARVVIDGKEDEAVILDGNFRETWGDCLHIDTVLYHGERKEHTVEITVVEAHEDDAVPFYLVSVIGSC